LTVALLLVALASLNACASPSGAPAPGQLRQHETDERLHGEFQRAGAGFACDVPAPLTPQQAERLKEENCLWLGRLSVGQQAAVLEPLLGQPDRLIPQQKGAVAQVYFSKAATGYLVATVVENRIAALQVTGEQPFGDWSFNRVTLGMTLSQLQEIMGVPMSKTNVPDIGAELWSYTPFPFSFEIKGGRVISIRIARSDFF